jgi:hypothetical protein
MPSVTRLALNVAAKVWPVVTARSRQGWRWLMAPRPPLTWADLRAKLRVRIRRLPSRNAGRLVVLGSIGLAVVGGIVLLLLLVLPWYAVEQKDDKGAVTYPHASLINPILGGLGALFLIYAALQQARTASRRHDAQTRADRLRRMTETFSTATEQLGSEKLEVRVGGIYTLERLAREALARRRGRKLDAKAEEASLYWTVVETLTAFVRERARWKEPDTSSSETVARFYEEAKTDRPEPVTDIAAVVSVIWRRLPKGRQLEERHDWRIDLRATDLRGADLTEVHLERAKLSGAHFERAVLVWAHLEGADLTWARLEGAHLGGTNLRKAHLADAYLYMAHLDGADLSEARGLTQPQIDQAHGDAATRLPEGLTQPAHWSGPARGGAAPASPPELP